MSLDLPAPPAPKRSDITAAHLAALAGRYHAPQTDDLLRLTVREGKLLGDGSELVPNGRGRFTNSGGGTTVSFSTETPLRLQVTSRNATVDYRAVAVAKPAAADLAVYAGSYRSAELDVVHVLTVKAGRLSAGRWPGPAVPPEPTFADGFMFGRGWPATFARDAGGGITGYELTNGRCRCVRFSRRQGMTGGRGSPPARRPASQPRGVCLLAKPLT